MALFFFNDTATTEIYTLSLHDALPISNDSHVVLRASIKEVKRNIVFIEARLYNKEGDLCTEALCTYFVFPQEDRKSTRLNSSHANISYAVFCLKKNNNLTPAPFITYHI